MGLNWCVPDLWPIFHFFSLLKVLGFWKQHPLRVGSLVKMLSCTNKDGTKFWILILQNIYLNWSSLNKLSNNRPEIFILNNCMPSMINSAGDRTWPDPRNSPDPLWSDMIHNLTLNDPISDPTGSDTTRNPKWPNTRWSDTRPNPTWYDSKPEMTRYPTWPDLIRPETRNDQTLNDLIPDLMWSETKNDPTLDDLISDPIRPDMTRQ
jgi:hypothetical protein